MTAKTKDGGTHGAPRPMLQAKDDGPPKRRAVLSHTVMPCDQRVMPRL